MAKEYFILTSAAHIMCPHGGRFKHHPSIPTDILIDGSPICREGDRFDIACPIGSETGCSRIRWDYDTTGVEYWGKAILTTDSSGRVYNSIDLFMGPPLWVSFQTRVTLPQFIEASKKYKKG